MRMYLSGWQATTEEKETAVIEAGAMKHRCFSFAGLRKLKGLPIFSKNLQGSYKACLAHKIGIMMDSSVFSYRSTKLALQAAGKPLTMLPNEDEFIALYVEWVKEFGHLWDFYVTIDLEPECKLNFARHKAICKMGIKPAPVYHGDDSPEYIKRYHDLGHTFMCFGSPKRMRAQRERIRRYLDVAFNEATKLNMKIHGLGLTSPWVMTEFPWFSTDSSSWSRVAGYGGIMRYDPDTRRLSILHVSSEHSGERTAETKQNPVTWGLIKEYVEADGYDLDKLQIDSVYRHIYNAATMAKLASDAEKGSTAAQWNLLFK